MPSLGAGTQYGFADDGHQRGELARAADYAAMALRAGFRLLDTARGYGTEEAVGRAVAAAGLDRSQVFLVSKAWPGVDHARGIASGRAAIAESAARLGGHVDLFLVHQPVAGWQDLWRALERAKDDGLVRAIGVSNFDRAHLEELLAFARHRPVANQIHLHPFVHGQRADAIRCCAGEGIAVMAFPRSPWHLGAGTAVDEVAAECGRSRAQVMLRWAVERGFAVIPLSTDARHLAENFAVGGFRLSPEQVAGIDRIGATGVRPRLRHHVDAVSREGVAGWAFAPGGLARILVLVAGETVGEAEHGRPRPDVRDAFPDEAGALASGFSFRFPAGCLRHGTAVTLAFELRDGGRTETGPLPVPEPDGT